MLPKRKVTEVTKESWKMLWWPPLKSKNKILEGNFNNIWLHHAFKILKLESIQKFSGYFKGFHTKSLWDFTLKTLVSLDGPHFKDPGAIRGWRLPYVIVPVEN